MTESLKTLLPKISAILITLVSVVMLIVKSPFIAARHELK